MNPFKFLLSFVLCLNRLIYHRISVFYYICKILIKIKPKNKLILIKRAIVHDLDKFRWRILKYFVLNYWNLKQVSFNSDQYKRIMEELKPIILLHYKKSRHHPEHFSNYNEMTEVDKLEMIADWISASKLQREGNIYSSIKINQERYHFSDEEKERLENIVKKLI